VLLNQLGSLNRERGDWAAAEAYHHQARQLSTAAGDDPGVGRASVDLGNLYRIQGQYGQAGRFLEEGLACAQACADRNLEAFAHTCLGLLYTDLGEPDRALACHQAAYAIWSEAHNLLGMAQAQHNAGFGYFCKKEYARAETYYQAALVLYEQAHARHYVAVASMDLGNVYLYQGQVARAEVLYRQAQAVMDELGNQRGLAQVANNLGMALARQEEWALAEESYRRSIVWWRQLGHALSQANAEDNLAEVYLKQQKWAAALHMLADARQHLASEEPTAPVRNLLRDIEQHEQAAQAGMTGSQESQPPGL
jgi:tetratricopeptide (TPR) repeat protein